MTPLEGEELVRWKNHLGKLYGRELSDEEVQEAAYYLISYFKLLMKIDREQRKNQMG